MPFNTDTLVIGDLYTRNQLALIWGYDGIEGFSKGVFTPANGKCIVLFVTHTKKSSATPFNDFINNDRLYWEGETKHSNDKRIASAHKNGEDIQLFYREIYNTPYRYYGSIRILNFIQQENKPSEFIFELLHDLSPTDDIARASFELSTISETERTSLIKARLGQGKFREDLLYFWGGCAITNIQKPELLRASHVMPWRDSNNSDRLNQYNGLLLLPQYDLLFDKGYITFDDSGALEPSPVISKFPQEKLGINFKARLRKIADNHLPFLEYHRNHVFFSNSNE